MWCSKDNRTKCVVVKLTCPLSFIHCLFLTSGKTDLHHKERCCYLVSKYPGGALFVPRVFVSWHHVEICGALRLCQNFARKSMQKKKKKISRHISKNSGGACILGNKFLRSSPSLFIFDYFSSVTLGTQSDHFLKQNILRHGTKLSTGSSR